MKNSARSALSIYEVFDDVLEKLQPTHILTQAQCDVCAVSLRDGASIGMFRLASTLELCAGTGFAGDGDYKVGDGYYAMSLPETKMV